MTGHVWIVDAQRVFRSERPLRQRTLFPGGGSEGPAEPPPSSLGYNAPPEKSVRAEPFDLSIVVPAYNEADRLPPTIAALGSFLRERPWRSEIVVVDDGSTDGTVDLVAARARLNGCLRVISTRPNRGKGHAVRTGALAARGQVIMFTDADLSIPIGIVDDFLRAIGAGEDIVIASRAHPQSREQVRPPLSRRIMTRVFRRVVHPSL